MSRDRVGEMWRRTDNGEDLVGYVKRSSIGATLYQGGGEHGPVGTPYQKWVHFVKVTLPSGEVAHRKWSEDSESPWELWMERVTCTSLDTRSKSSRRSLMGLLLGQKPFDATTTAKNVAVVMSHTIRVMEIRLTRTIALAWLRTRTAVGAVTQECVRCISTGTARRTTGSKTDLKTSDADQRERE